MPRSAFRRCPLPRDRVYGGRFRSPVAKDREEARRIGAPRFFAAEPCARGHQPVRYVSSNACCECAKENARVTQAELVRLREAALLDAECRAAGLID
jgi:hypothetical protein